MQDTNLARMKFPLKSIKDHVEPQKTIQETALEFNE